MCLLPQKPPEGLAQLTGGVLGSAPPPVWVVQYKDQSGGKTHANSKDEEFPMVNISEWLTWQGRVLSGEAEKLGAGQGGLSVDTRPMTHPSASAIAFLIEDF